MKKTLLTAVIMLMFSISFAQTATNFTCNDCSGISHNLFTELDAGKVVVICWVMPCGSCVGPSLTTYNVVQSFENTHPDKVVMYLCDDFANTNCTSLNSWASNIGISKVTFFSNTAIDMMDYGSPGMPKVVVVADVSHAVFYNANDMVNATALQDAINTAIVATTTGIIQDPEAFGKLRFFPNPAYGSSFLSFLLDQTSDITIEIYDPTGKKLAETSYPGLPIGKHSIGISTTGLINGIYFIKLTDGVRSNVMKIAVAR
jgi:hypothetical protein